MNFYEYEDLWSQSKRSGIAKLRGWTDRQQMYSHLAKYMTDQFSMRHFNFDVLWHKSQCPYYDVYPSIIPMLTKLDLDMSGSHIVDTYLLDRQSAEDALRNVNLQLSETSGKIDWPSTDAYLNGVLYDSAYLPHLLVRLPQTGHSIQFYDTTMGTVRAKTIFMSLQTVNMKYVTGYVEELVYGMVVGIDIGEKISDGDCLVPTYLIQCIPLTSESLRNSLDCLPEHHTANEGIKIPREVMNDCLKLCITLRLIRDDPELIEPDVMSKDRQKYVDSDNAVKQQLIDKAIRRGKHGYRVGHLLEQSNISPHVRRPHPALVWTGEGRRVPRVVMRKGSIVHREKINNIPTGYKPIE